MPVAGALRAPLAGLSLASQNHSTQTDSVDRELNKLDADIRFCLMHTWLFSPHPYDVSGYEVTSPPQLIRFPSVIHIDTRKEPQPGPLGVLMVWHPTVPPQDGMDWSCRHMAPKCLQHQKNELLVRRPKPIDMTLPDWAQLLCLFHPVMIVDFTSPPKDRKFNVDEWRVRRPCHCAPLVPPLEHHCCNTFPRPLALRT